MPLFSLANLFNISEDYSFSNVKGDRYLLSRKINGFVLDEILDFGVQGTRKSTQKIVDIFHARRMKQIQQIDYAESHPSRPLAIPILSNPIGDFLDFLGRFDKLEFHRPLLRRCFLRCLKCLDECASRLLVSYCEICKYA